MAISSGHQEHFSALKVGLHHQNMRLMHENDFAEQPCEFAIHFEDLIAWPRETLREALRKVDIYPAADDLGSGEVDRWHEWVTPRLVRSFSGNRITTVARQRG